MRENLQQQAEVRERRKFPRVSVTCDVKYRAVEMVEDVPDFEDGSGGIMKNISGGGVCIVANEIHEIGQMLALELTLPGFPSDVISYGRVAWCRSREDTRFDVGVEFWWVGWNDDEAQKHIRGFITDALRSDDASAEGRN